MDCRVMSVYDMGIDTDNNVPGEKERKGMNYYCGMCNNNCQFTKEEMIRYGLLEEDLDIIINCFCPYMREYTEFVQEDEEEEE